MGGKNPTHLDPWKHVQSKAVDTGNRHAGAGRITLTKGLYSSLQVTDDWKQNGFRLLAEIPSSFLLF